MKQILIVFFIMLNAISVCAQDVEDADTLVKRGFSQISNKDLHSKALQDFERVIELSPQYIDAYLGKAIILKRQGHWKEAKKTLSDASQHVDGKLKSGQYLAQSAWQEGYYDLARQLDEVYKPDSQRKIMEYSNEVSLNYGYDWINNRDDWWELNFSYQHRIRPDHSALLYYSEFRRDTDNDFFLGFGYVFKWNYMTSFAVDAYFSDKSGFTANQKYRPRVYFRLPHNFALGVGGNFDQFADDWAAVSHTEVTKYFQEFYGKYTILAGEDNLGQAITTHIGEMGYEKEEVYTVRMGYATGNESLERTDRIIDSSIDIDTYYLSAKYFVASNWGLNLSFSREYRDNDFFRNTASTSIFYRF